MDASSNPQRPWLRNLLIVYLPLALWAVVIFLFSTGTFAFGHTVGMLWRTLREFNAQLRPGTLVLITDVVRKIAHVTEYFILALLVWRVLRGRSPERWRSRWAWWTMALCVGYAITDEVHQIFVPHRHSSPLDVVIDAGGAGLLLVIVYWRARRAERATTVWSPDS